MNTQHGNPFVLPGFGHGVTDQNPLLASMEMMRQAWQNVSAGGGLFQQPMAASPMTTEELDRRIADMRAVESWLRLNLSMLSSSIQALEVQRATLSTLKSYMGFSPESASAPSPLDVALGIKPSGQAKIKPARGNDTAGSAPEDTSKDAAAQAAEPLTEAAQAWWNMLQQQFESLATATAASMPPQASPGHDDKPKAKPAAKSTAKKAPRKRAAPTKTRSS
ncbi:transcriptional regulator [Pusillimonas sp. CC-YST705]|uniref:Transcriptional regulator n=1 Tax=Mesopusillimonas faecipullorum TaxID=2755040 RepID=A0ABS8C9M3_9BURK|nr:PhaM family polyhydroxyalkanoate granule multifunctional regulatory protein [Mesopusillimonas faecipullorum]MCB5362737.1 transcriptional regulator [Mesopusillimonas faecipullorum]